MGSMRLSPWLALVFSVGATQLGQTNELPVRTERLALEQKLAKAADNPPDPQQTLADARSRLAASLEGLERMLARSGPSASRDWGQWLHLEVLNAELSRDLPDAAALRKVEQRFYRNDAGLEKPEFLAVRDDLGRYLTAAGYASETSPAEHYRHRLDGLAQALSRLDAHPSDEAALQAGQDLAWLERLSPQGAALAVQVRSDYSRPNALVQVSARFINSLMEQKVEEHRYLSDIVLGNLTRGPAHTWGQVSFGVVPSPSQAVLEVRLSGYTSSPRTVAERGRISVYSSAMTTMQANKRVLMSDQGLTLQPAAAACRTSAQIMDVQAGRRFIERIAWRRAQQMLPEAEQAAARQAEVQTAEGLDERAGEALGGVNDMFCDQIRAPLVRLDALPAVWRFWTDPRHLRTSLVQASGKQLAAVTPPPKIPVDYDMAFSGHESMVNNLCETMLGGRVVRDQAWLDLMNLLTGAQPRALWVHDRAERWSVRLAPQRPLLAEFQDGRVGFTLRIVELTRGEDEVEQHVEIAARFVTHKTQDGPALIREGDIEIRFAEGEGDEDARAFLARKFRAVFPAELHFHGLVPPSGGSLGRLRALDLERFTSQNGWIVVGFQMQGTERIAESAEMVSR